MSAFQVITLVFAVIASLVSSTSASALSAPELLVQHPSVVHSLSPVRELETFIYRVTVSF